MIILRDDDLQDEDDDKIDSPFPAAFSPTLNTTAFSLDIDFSAISGKQPEANSETAGHDLYAQVIPKSQRKKVEKNELETSADAPVSNGRMAISVDPYSQYATVIPKSERKQVTGTRTVANSSAYSPKGESDRQKQTIQARSQVLSAIGNQPIAIKNDNNEMTYYRNVPTAQRIENALGGKVTYTESAEL